jgi:hypothetical protein
MANYSRHVPGLALVLLGLILSGVGLLLFSLFAEPVPRLGAYTCWALGSFCYLGGVIRWAVVGALV